MYHSTISYFRSNLSHASIVLGIAAASIVGAAWLFQLVGYAACQLCLWQRTPYYIAIPLLVLAGAASSFGVLSVRTLRWVVVLSLVVLAAGGLLAIYHSGVEWGFWPGPTSCGVGGNFASNNATDLFSSLETTRPPSCNEAAGRFVGLSFAGWNAVAAFGLTAIGLVVAKKA